MCCDDLSLAYSASLYFRTVAENGEVHSHLIASKPEVAPENTLNIPRLELCGAHLFSNLLASIRPSLRHTTVWVDDVRLWTDSEIVLYLLCCEKTTQSRRGKSGHPNQRIQSQYLLANNIMLGTFTTTSMFSIRFTRAVAYFFFLYTSLYLPHHD